MQRRKSQVSGFGNAQRRLNRFQVAHFADEHDVGVFAERGAKRIRERMRVGMDFALVHEALLVIVKKLDRILDRDHVLFAFAVDLVEHGGKRGGLTGTRWPSHQDKPAGLVAQALHDERQSQGVEALDFPWNRTEDRANGSSLIENVATEARQVFQTERKI